MGYRAIRSSALGTLPSGRISWGKTANKGIDLVLNSLSGDLLHPSWHCVAEFGKFIEVGKRDLLGRGQLDMEVFLARIVPS